ncbi:hypothetical protein EHQ42_07890 [Leptospira levettii]|uniref:hypothetical protein n=1 Tax=Leptospira levettii TaxID=2023178 RepID=UPI00108406F6|nr:hypothetical protein [Leptospira levettii]TGL18091.1 hypothetical protein EHQ42_07890 [Leptospira levettii]
MRPVIVIPIFSAIVFVLFGNYYLVSGTNKKIEGYKENPPFRIEDATASNGLSLLLDKNPSTVWRKIRNSPLDFDFFLEMKLSHVWDGEVFQPRTFQSLEVKACPGETIPPFTLRFLLRESINVDKELRMPKDKIAFVYPFQEKGIKQISIPLDKLPKFQIEKDYPNQIFILTPEFKIESQNGCLAEVTLKEKL